jgi:hypothetical protein
MPPVNVLNGWIFLTKKTGREQPLNKSGVQVEDQVLRIRQYLKNKSILGLYGAEAIRTEMIRRGIKKVPAIRTIAHIVQRHGLVDRRRRVRYPAPFLVGICATL